MWDKRQPLAPTHEFWGHEADINCVEFCSDGYTFVSGSDDASVRLWDLRSSRELAKFCDEGVIHGITSIGISRSGRIIYAGQDDYNCMMWDTLDPLKEPIRLGSNSNLPNTHESSIYYWRISRRPGCLHRILGYSAENMGMKNKKCNVYNHRNYGKTQRKECPFIE